MASNVSPEEGNFKVITITGENNDILPAAGTFLFNEEWNTLLIPEYMLIEAYTSLISNLYQHCQKILKLDGPGDDDFFDNIPNALIIAHDLKEHISTLPEAIEDPYTTQYIEAINQAIQKFYYTDNQVGENPLEDFAIPAKL